MRVVKPFNDDWIFSECFDPALLEKNADTSSMKPIRIPHTVVETPYNCFSEGIYQFVSVYRKTFTPGDAWKEKRIILNFDGAAHQAEVYLNEQHIGSHLGGYTAFQVDLSKHLMFGEENVLVVKLDSRETLNIPPFGHVIDYLTYGGLYREVSLEVTSRTWIEDVFVHTTDVLEENQKLHVKTTLPNTSLEDRVKVVHELYKENELIQQLTDGPASYVKDATYIIKNGALWDIDTPHLYTLKTTLYEDGEPVDELSTSFGIREASFKRDGFYLNGKKVKLRGLNRHQSWPYVGYAMPEGPQKFDAEILKYELGLNAVRTSHYPQSKHFIDHCDRIGLIVFTEIPGWQNIGDQQWQDVAVEMTREMVCQYRNHPSIVLWGVRINESLDNNEFYQRTNEMARNLDPSRQTSGVRYIKNSNLLEDVYSFNDFSHTGNNRGILPKSKVTKEKTKGYLVTEFNGHMYPTKSFDKEVSRLSHALRHARVLDDIANNEDVSGGFGWCMFDYNTHKDFGSGDRICYHGVMDSFRNPKLASAVYASQKDDTPVLEISSEMSIGDHEAGTIKSIYAFTNAEKVNMYVNDTFVKSFYPDRDVYKGLKHPPVFVDDTVGERLAVGEGYNPKVAERIKKVIRTAAEVGDTGLPLSVKLKALQLMIVHGLKFEDFYKLYGKYVGNWGDQVTTYRFDAIKGDQVVASVTKAPMEKVSLEVIADRLKLSEKNTYDVATIRIRAVDQNNNILHYWQEPVFLETTGPVEIIGPKVLSLKGGMGGTYIKTIGTTGEATLKVKTETGEFKTLTFAIEKIQ
jgi:beta-galactosidase